MAEAKIVPPQYETGYVRDGITDLEQWNFDEELPELQWPQCNRIYYRMTHEDGRVASVMQAIGLPVRRTNWWIEPNGARDEVVEDVAMNLGLPILGTEPTSLPRTRGRFSWSQHLQWALLMLPYGHSYFEQVYTFDETTKRLRLRKLGPRPQRTISKFNVALDGGLESIKQYAPASTDRVTYGIAGVEIPVSRLVAYVRDPEPGDWKGTSMLRPAYKHWLLKDDLIRLQAATARRNGMGMPVGTAANKDDAEVKHMQDLASNARSGMKSGIGLAPGQAFEFKGVEGNLPDMQAAINYHDRSIALAGLAHFLNLDGRGGSHALASVQEDTFTQSVQTFGESIRDTANSHIVEDLVDLNFGPDEVAPRIVFDEIGSRQDATAAALGILVQNGLLEADEALRVSLRQKFGLTPPDPNDETAPAVTLVEGGSEE